ncbi:MAG: AMP-binding protein [Verrucomicrobiae bacterium]|nr:AMP-binding protein [Verrucomicrobiae bacterium]
MNEGAHPDRMAMMANQLDQLRSLLAELIPANVFYTRKLQSHGATFDVASLEDYSARFPFTTKPELVEDQRRNPPFGTNLTYPLNRYTRFHQTSGTSGTPLRWLDTPESWDGMVEDWMNVFRAAGVAAGDRVYFAFSFGPFIGFWMAYESAARLGCLCLPGGGMSSAARLRAIMENGATVLCCTPTYAIRLGEVAAEEKLDLGAARVRRIIVAGEPGGSVLATRARIESLWAGARVFDHHGMTEVGPVTFECPAQPGVLHVMESGYYAEIIDPATCRPIPPGETGELVLTTLGRTGSPLLRYRTGDLVRRGTGNGTRGTPCACGSRELALDGGILGRVDDMLIVRGVNVYPSAVEEIVRSCEGVAEYQVRITEAMALTEMRVEIEPTVDCRDATQLAARVTKAFETALALRVPVSAVTPGALPRYEMKAKRWVRGA